MGIIKKIVQIICGFVSKTRCGEASETPFFKIKLEENSLDLEKARSMRHAKGLHLPKGKNIPHILDISFPSTHK